MLPAEGGKQSLVDVYNRYFQYRIARTSQEFEAAHRLRYDVYCEETGFLSKSENPNGLEQDEHDCHSLQSVLYHRLSGVPVGTVRVVLPLPDMPGCGLPARVAAPGLDLMPESLLPRATTGEISRFSIHGDFRKRRGDGLYPALHTADMPDPRRIIPHMTLGLMTSIFEMTLEAGLTHLCAIIDPALWRMLRMLGLHFKAAGPQVDFHGPRQPVYASCDELIALVRDNNPDIYGVISSNERFQIHAHSAAL